MDRAEDERDLAGWRENSGCSKRLSSSFVVCLVHLVSLVSLVQPNNETNQINQSNQSVPTLHGCQDRRSTRCIARHPAATPAANITPIIQPEDKLIRLGSRRRRSRLRFGIWDSGPSHSSSDERGEAFLKRMAVLPSLIPPLLSSKPTHPDPI